MRDMKQVWALPSGPPGIQAGKSTKTYQRPPNGNATSAYQQAKGYSDQCLCCAPTMTNPEDIIDQFYEQLDALIAAVPKSGKVIILGE